MKISRQKLSTTVVLYFNPETLNPKRGTAAIHKYKGFKHFSLENCTASNSD